MPLLTPTHHKRNQSLALSDARDRQQPVNNACRGISAFKHNQISSDMLEA